MRHLVLLASVYALVAALVLPSSLVASDEPVPPVAPEAGETETAPAEPEPAAPVPAPAASPAPEAQQGSAPATGSEPAPAPTPPQAQPAPAPAEQQQPAAPAAEPRRDQDLGDERDQLRPKTRRVVATAAASSSVTIQNFAFSPKSVTVDVGDTVTWTNQDDVEHSATAEDGSFDTGTFGNGKSRSHTFNTAGTFQYVCTPHPFMKGTITVSAAGGGESGSGQTDSGSSGDTRSSGGSSSSAGSTQSGSGTSGSSSSSDSGSALPDTGADAATLAILGLLMLGLGVAVQRRARAKEG